MHHELLQVMAGMRNVEDRRVAARRAAIREVTRSQRRRRGRGARMLWVLPVSMLLLLGFFIVTSPRADAHASDSALARISAAAGAAVFGGVTSQDFPVLIETSKKGRRAKAVIAIRLTCASGGAFTTPDGYSVMTVDKKRRFSASFGPETDRNDDGTTTDYEGSINGSFNKPRTKVSGTWSLKATDHDASGAITETCDSGRVNWTAKQ